MRKLLAALLALAVISSPGHAAQQAVNLNNGEMYPVVGSGGSGSGDVTGPASSVDSEIALFSGTTGKIIKRATGSGIVTAASGVYGTTTNNSSNWDSAYTETQAIKSTLGFVVYDGTGGRFARSIAEGLAIDVTNGDGQSGNPTIAFDPTELTGNRTWAAGGSATVAWTYDLSGTDVVVTFGSASMSIGAADFAAGSVTSGGVLVPTISSTSTLTNKRITARVQSVADAATITPNADANDAVDITAIAQAFTIANPSGTPTNFQKLIIRIKDDGNAWGITWGSDIVPGGVALPSTTVPGKILNVGLQYNTANALNKWQCLAAAQEA